MSAWSHWPPRVGERIRVEAREDKGLQSSGKIVVVDRTEHEVLIQFDGRKIIREVNYFEWNGHWCSNMCWIVDGIKYHQYLDVLAPEMLLPGGDVDNYSFDILQGNWSSTDNGEGQWVI